MSDYPSSRSSGPDPGACRHPSFERIGIQKAPVPPFRLYLVTCRACGTTLATATLRRHNMSGSVSVGNPEEAEDGEEEGAAVPSARRSRPRRKAG